MMKLFYLTVLLATGWLLTLNVTVTLWWHQFVHKFFVSPPPDGAEFEFIVVSIDSSYEIASFSYFYGKKMFTTNVRLVLALLAPWCPGGWPRPVIARSWWRLAAPATG
jgi:hypothetical protein